MTEPLRQHYLDCIEVIEGRLETMRRDVEHGKPHRIRQDARSVIRRCCDLIEYATADVLKPGMAPVPVKEAPALTWRNVSGICLSCSSRDCLQQLGAATRCVACEAMTTTRITHPEGT